MNTTELKKTYKKAFPKNIIPNENHMVIELLDSKMITLTVTNEGQVFVLTEKGINLWRNND